MDVADALQRLGDDRDLLREIIQIYLEDSPAMMDNMHASAASGDAAVLQRAAHSLKGLASTLSAFDVVGAAARLEHMAASHQLHDAEQLVAEVQRRVTELNEAVQAYLRRK